MHLDVTSVNLQGTGTNIRLSREPDNCPVCHKNIHPKLISSGITQQRNLAQCIFRCTSLECQEFFIATYNNTHRTSGGRELFEFKYIAPITPLETTFSDSINEVSPTFVEIYNQALFAESSGLTQLVGIGLRKSLEFLVKDFAISQDSEKEEEIKSGFLGQCINEYIQDTNVKACAKRAAWLGNDETHYIRKWEERDINDLKLLVKLTMNWIENVILTAQYIEEMSE